MQNLKKLIFTECNGWYSQYRPVFEYFARRAYPDSEVFVLDYGEKELPCEYFCACDRLIIDAGDAAMGELNDFDRVYITDIDMLLLPGENLFSYHESVLKKTDLPYNNTMRRGEPFADQRLTGLHYATTEWYLRTYEARKNYRNGLCSGGFGNDRFDDEKILFNVVKESGLGFPPMQPRVRLHFGIHLGTLRAYRYKSRETMNSQLKMRIGPAQAEMYLKACRDPEFGDVLDKVTHDMVLWQLKTLHSFCMRRAKG